MAEGLHDRGVFPEELRLRAVALREGAVLVRDFVPRTGDFLLHPSAPGIPSRGRGCRRSDRIRRCVSWRARKGAASYAKLTAESGESAERFLIMLPNAGEMPITAFSAPVTVPLFSANFAMSPGPLPSPVRTFLMRTARPPVFREVSDGLRHSSVLSQR